MVISDSDLQNLINKQQLLAENKLEQAVTLSQNNGTPLLSCLIENGFLTEEKLYREIAQQLNLPFIRLNISNINKEFLRILPEKVARKAKAVIFKKDTQEIGVALIDPSNTDLSDMIAKKTKLQVTTYLTTPSDIKTILPFYRDSLQKTIDLLLKEKTVAYLETAPIAKIVDMLVDYAYSDRASDIHIEPEEDICLIRFRTDGILHDVLKLPKDLNERIVSRIKVLAKLRTDEHLSPQDGKFRFTLEQENIDIRVSIIPVADGEKVVLRLLSSRAREYDLLNIGLNEADLGKITKNLNKSHGMILSTGPTGSGKTTTIYALIKILNSRERNITTIEDPVEYRIKGVNQIQLNLKTNLTFANGLGSILRQDPDIIFVGEIRDSQTAGIAVNAALTGHLVLSTVHTSDAVGALPRLLEMGVEELLLASTVNIIIAQRLLRKICEKCKEPYSLSYQELAKNIPADLIKKIFKNRKIGFYRGSGCSACHQTGYLGRIGIFEILPITKPLRKLISKGADTDEISELAVREGMVTMLEDGLEKAYGGITSIEEVLRTTKIETL